MKVTTLIDNSKGKRELTSEWGLSLHLEANGQRILFDTGTSSAFAENARKLKVDLSRVDMAVLSHGHFDHGGGLSAFFAANEKAPLYLRTTADGYYYGRILFFTRYLGLDRALLESHKSRIRWVENDAEIAPGLHILTSMTESEPKPDTRRKILMKTEHGLVPDEFKHELALVVEEKDGISIVTGCGHLGVLNMVSAAKRKFPNAMIKAVIGGFHMISNPFTGGMAVSPSEVKAIASRFKELGCQRVVSGHCTGKKASDILSAELKESYIRLSTGATFEV